MQQLTASVSRVYDDLCGLIEKENRLTEFGLYGLSTGIFAYAYYRKRPITKFIKASQIPKHFVEEKVLQTGTIRKIEPTDSGPRLYINHKPPVNVILSSRSLPTRVAGVQIDGNGFSWLQVIATGKPVKFIPFSNIGSDTFAKVILTEKGKRPLDVGRALVSLGFAKVVPLNQEIGFNVDKNIQRYLKQLKSSESRAKRLRKGQWSFLPESWFRWKIRSECEKLLFKMKSDEKKIPVMLR